MCSCLCIPIQYHIYERNTDLFPSPMDGKPATDSALRPDILAKAAAGKQPKVFSIWKSSPPSNW